MGDWKFDAEDYLDQYHMIDETDFLSMADFAEIAREVW